MRLAGAIRNTLVLLAILLLNTFSSAGHTSAMSTMSHETKGVSRSSREISSCSTLCRTVVTNREENIIRDNKNKDGNEPVLPFHAQNRPWLSDSATPTQELYVDTFKPPPEAPVYILYGVFRA